MTALTILPIATDDLPFVREMLHAAAFWRDLADAPPIDEALRGRGLGVYIDGWGRPGDAGLIARVRGTPGGAVWVREFRGDDRGYGFVDERTPELSIAVAPLHRGRGIGRCLLTAMLVELRLRGVDQVSLSVETDNPAVELYASLGFARRDVDDGAATMVRTLT